MAARYLIDTDVLVEYLRGSPRAIRYLERLEGELLLSAITVAELFSGARDESSALNTPSGGSPRSASSLAG